ncbi:hypothetical protein N7574_08760 [Acinetobacter ursingii]|uniref:Uncharacterized protein n=2 Tax=Acinetobacter TaxID=469 RepID=N9D890_9GAMM|nr:MULTISPECIES: hypothetical protein [Acinetobacter]ENV78864.1 hypothetical protein F942_02286 [Acinetobacter ursingii ANC 3649]MDG9949414.1 hypothetical protein [Acinetobacter ursingii]MEC6126307.1 hypothetical protein [Acinetobacter ursingii]QXZ23703.1 hypothetical protein I6L31_02615 [Acinetobacter septicus]RSC24064.1 hypothetical protein EGS47_15595 [Acinetobacter sp. FDAARGOS_515]
MTAFVPMKASLREDEMIPHLAVEAFRHAFCQASQSASVVYAKDQYLLKQSCNGETQILKNISSYYTDIAVSETTLKRKKKVAF